MNYKRFVLGAIILVESVAGAAVVWRIRVWQEERKNVLGMHVTRIPKESLVFPKNELLSHYFEPKPNYVEKDHPDWLNYEVTYQFNGEGIRAEQDHTVAKPAATYRIITLGDSFTFGLFVNDGETYPKQLEDLLNIPTCGKTMKFEVMNLGVPAYDMAYSVERYRLHGQKYHPDLVIWLINEHNVLQLRDLLTPLVEKIRKETSEAAKLAYYAKNEYYFAERLAMEELEKKFGDEYIFSVQRAVFARFSDFYTGPLVLIMFASASERTREVINSLAHSRRNTYFHLLPDLGQMGGQLPDSHPNAQGHTAIANNVYQYLLRQKLVSCP